MRRRTVLLGVLSGAMGDTLAQGRSQSTAKVEVDWQRSIARTTPNTFGSNDYEITRPQAAADSTYQRLIANLGVRFIRIHHAELCDRWTNAQTRSWDISKIKGGYDVSYPHRPTIVQNIPGWAPWMRRTPEGLLDPTEIDRYAAFCADLVRVINQRLRYQVKLWEPLNEQDVAYQKAGKLEQLWLVYNRAAAAMKAVDPTIQVGGPVLTWDNSDRLTAFLRTSAPHVDFISWHRYASGNVNDSTETLMAATLNYGQQVRRFREIAFQSSAGRTIPLFLSEYNLNYSWQSGETRHHTHIGAVWFASVLKHLAEAGIEMAASWHLKDQIYGLIDAANRPRPAATVFAWANQYLVGTVLATQSSQAVVEAIAVQQSNDDRSLLLLNKSARAVPIQLQMSPIAQRLPLMLRILDADGVKQQTLRSLEKLPSVLAPYSISLLQFPRVTST